MNASKTPPICYGQINQGTWCQETYESASKHASIRARALRKAGYVVHTGTMGPQVTRVGIVRLSLVDILPGNHNDTCNLPVVQIERL